MTRRLKRHRRRHGLAWRITAGTIRRLIDLSGESYLAYRKMRRRLQKAHEAPDAVKASLEIRRSRRRGRLDEPAPRDAMLDAISALVNLGYRHAQAELAITHAALAVGERASTAQLVKIGLKALAS
jgi:Holliday junction resolvasome RuvABC DNA-binding subunit